MSVHGAVQKKKCCCGEPCWVLAQICECEDPDPGDPLELYVCCTSLPPLGSNEVDLPEPCIFVYPPGEPGAKCYEIPADPPLLDMIPPDAVTFCPPLGVFCQFESCDECCPPPPEGCPTDCTGCNERLIASVGNLRGCYPADTCCHGCGSFVMGLDCSPVGPPHNPVDCDKFRKVPVGVPSSCNWLQQGCITLDGPCVGGFIVPTPSDCYQCGDDWECSNPNGGGCTCNGLPDQQINNIWLAQISLSCTQGFWQALVTVAGEQYSVLPNGECLSTTCETCQPGIFANFTRNAIGEGDCGVGIYQFSNGTNVLGTPTLEISNL
jgi:hypothetical protein